MTITLPVMKSDPGEHSRHISAPISSWRAIRRAGILRTRRLSRSSELSTSCWASVMNPPGATALTWMPWRAHSAASARVSCTSAPFEAE